MKTQMKTDNDEMPRNLNFHIGVKYCCLREINFSVERICQYKVMNADWGHLYPWFNEKRPSYQIGKYGYSGCSGFWYYPCCFWLQERDIQVDVIIMPLCSALWFAERLYSKYWRLMLECIHHVCVCSFDNLGHVARTERRKNSYIILVKKAEKKRTC
jgi:hypothetical protein